MKAMVLVLSSLTLLAANSAQAAGFQNVEIGRNFEVNEAETQSIPLNAARHVRNLVIQAEGIRSDSMIEVMVNGQVKGTIYAPGRDPSYIVTIAETARSVEFRHRSGGAMRVLSVMATLSDWSKPEEGGGGYDGDKESVRQLAQIVLARMEQLRLFATPEENKEYLYPIKRNAGLVLVMLSAHGNISKRTIAQITALVDQIDFARAYLNGLMQKEEAFEAVVDLLTVRESLADMLD